jgi:hypothetical protein
VPDFVNYKKGAFDSQPQVIKVYQLLAQGWWFSPGTPSSSTTKTGRHDIAEILLRVALKHQKSKSINPLFSKSTQEVFSVKGAWHSPHTCRKPW